MLYLFNALLDHILDPSLTIAWKVAIGVEKPANEIRETIRLDQRYLFDHAKTTLASRIDQLDKGTAPKDVNWGMEAVVAGSMYKGISVEKRVETLYNLSVQKGQLTSAQQKELGDIYDLTSSNFIVHASTMGSMSMEKAEFQKGLERIAEGQTYLGYALINVAVGKMTQYNLDAGVGISNYDDPANTRFNIESKGGVVARNVAVGNTTDAMVAPVTTQPVSPSVSESVASSTTQHVVPIKAVDSKVPSLSTTVKTVETKAPTAIKATDVSSAMNNFLGLKQTNIHPVTGANSTDRIFSDDGSKSVRFGSHEMNSMDTSKAHFHFETWSYDPITDTMIISNVLQRIIP